MTPKKILFLILAGTILFAGCSNVQSENEKAPDFSLEDLNNRTVRLSDYQDKVIVLNFFATWCPPCRDEIPDFIDLVSDYGDKGLVIIGISLDRSDKETVRNFANGYGINYPVLFDDGLVSETYGPIRSIPTTFIIDKKKNIVQRIVGSRKRDYFESVIKPLL